MILFFNLEIREDPARSFIHLDNDGIPSLRAYVYFLSLHLSALFALTSGLIAKYGGTRSVP